MKKSFLVLLVLGVLGGALFAGPFGLTQGMTLREVQSACGGKAPQRIENDDRYYIQPEKSHSSFKTYIAWISPEFGLYAVRGISDKITTNDYGAELKDAFYAFESRLEKIYGSGNLFDGLVDKNTVWKAESYWLNALQYGARELYCEWYPEDKDDVMFVKLWGVYAKYDSSQLVIDYQFKNIEKVNNQEDDVL